LTMYIFYRKDIDVVFVPPVLNPEACLKDKRGIAFHGSVLFLTRLFLGVSGNINAQNWVITTVGCLMSLMYNAYYWPWDKPAVSGKEPVESKASALEMASFEKSTPEKAPYAKFSSSPSIAEKEFLNGEAPIGTPNGDVQAYAVVSEQGSFSNKGTEETEASLKKPEAVIEEATPEEISVEEPTVKASILNCPWAVMPFVFGMFTLVNALNDYGWIDALANAILNVIPGNEGNSPHAIAIATFLMTTISFILCTLIDNQPASILLTQVLLSPSFSALPTYVRTAGMLGVLEGANVGGCWSLMGALAGIMWSTLLRNKGITIGYIQFMRVGLKIMPLTTFIVALIIFFEAWGKS